MTPKQIQRRYNTIQRNLDKWETAETQLQELCAHPNATKKYCGNSGNYDPSADSYWIEWKCPDCQKRWNTEQ